MISDFGAQCGSMVYEVAIKPIYLFSNKIRHWAAETLVARGLLGADALDALLQHSYRGALLLTEGTKVPITNQRQHEPP
jgi:hypothetical protein